MRACPRNALANLLKEHCLVDSGADAVTQWLKEEGINAPLGSVLLVRAMRTALQCHAGPPAALA